MEKCPICDDGRVMTRLSSAGEEKFCLDCRRITASAELEFEFKIAKDENSDGIEQCTLNGRPGWKGPGEKARCWTYDTGDHEAEQYAHKKAKDSLYAYQSRKAKGKAAAKLATPGFTGAPTTFMPPTDPTSTPSTKPVSAQGGMDFSSKGQTGIGAATAPGGIQPGDLNAANPLNSGTTANKRLAELLSEELGPSFCTEHMTHDECNHAQNSQ